MHLGAFSLSLAVENLEVSQRFYEQIGFAVFAGDPADKFLIMKSGKTLIGLFQDMLPKNILTFNPGWDQEAQKLPEFIDVRVLHERATAAGLAASEVNLPGNSGPGSFMLSDPDGNLILIDQHI
jgi:hypothetical protein